MNPLGGVCLETLFFWPWRKNVLQNYKIFSFHAIFLRFYSIFNIADELMSNELPLLYY